MESVTQKWTTEDDRAETCYGRDDVTDGGYDSDVDDGNVSWRDEETRDIERRANLNILSSIGAAFCALGLIYNANHAGWGNGFACALFTVAFFACLGLLIWTEWER